MSEFYQNLSHSRWDCKYHVVFVPKRRRQVIFGQVRRQLGEIFHALARQKECRARHTSPLPPAPRGREDLVRPEFLPAPKADGFRSFLTSSPKRLTHVLNHAQMLFQNRLGLKGQVASVGRNVKLIHCDCTPVVKVIGDRNTPRRRESELRPACFIFSHLSRQSLGALAIGSLLNQAP